MIRLFKKDKQYGKFYLGEKSRKSPSPNKPTPRPTKKLERGHRGEEMTDIINPDEYKSTQEKANGE